MVRSPLYPPTIFVLRLALGLAIGWLLIEGELVRALITTVFLGLSIAYFLRDDRRATLFDVLFALAALLGAIGYMFGLFEEVAPYDELEHAFMAFSVSLAFFFLFYGGAVPRRQAVAKATSVFTLGVAVARFGRSSSGRRCRRRLVGYDYRPSCGQRSSSRGRSRGVGASLTWGPADIAA